jgi:hypothetical protein
LFQADDLRITHGQAARYAEVSSEIEQVVLYILQRDTHHFLNVFCQQYPDAAIEFIHGANSFYTQAFLSASCAIAQAGSTVVAGTRIDSGKTISHS